MWSSGGNIASSGKAHKRGQLKEAGLFSCIPSLIESSSKEAALSIVCTLFGWIYWITLYTPTARWSKTGFFKPSHLTVVFLSKFPHLQYTPSTHTHTHSLEMVLFAPSLLQILQKHFRKSCFQMKLLHEENNLLYCYLFFFEEKANLAFKAWNNFTKVKLKAKQLLFL